MHISLDSIPTDYFFIYLLLYIKYVKKAEKTLADTLNWRQLPFLPKISNQNCIVTHEKQRLTPKKSYSTFKSKWNLLFK